MRFEFIRSANHGLSVKRACRALNVSRGGYYEHIKRCSYSSVKGDSPFRRAFLAMLTQARQGLRSPAAVRLRTEPCPS